MIFKHEPIDLGYKDLSCVTKKTGRKYETPKGNSYPSITTILSLQSKQAIMAWRARVGEVEANRVSRKASSRGTAVHTIAEKYVNNDLTWKDAALHAVGSFMDIKPILDERLTTVYGQELPLYSDHLGVAGRVDCVGIFDGKLSIIDYKTSSKPKKYEWVKNYFIQETFYAIAWEERTGMPITQLVTIITVDNNDPQVFIEHRDNWDKELIRCIKEYKEQV
jgi:genome maintenance exonuclease 1